MSYGYLVGFDGWGSIENLYHALNATTPKDAVTEFLKEVEDDPHGVLAHDGHTETPLIFVYKLGKEMVFVPKAIDYVQRPHL